MLFYTNDTEKMRITSAGKIGVGMTNPVTTINVQTGSASSYTGGGAGESIRVSTGNSNVWMACECNGITAYYGATSAGSVKFAGYNYATSASIDMEIGQGAMYVKANGNILISNLETGLVKSSSGTLSNATSGTDYQAPITLTTTGNSGSSTFVSNTLNVPTYTLAGLGGITPAAVAASYVPYSGANSNINAGSYTITAGAFYESSDIRFKNVLETNPTISALGIDVIKFTREGQSQVRYGYSAQQVQSILPDAVIGYDELVVNYMDVHTLKIASLEKRVAELESRLKSTI